MICEVYIFNITIAILKAKFVIFYSLRSAINMVLAMDITSVRLMAMVTPTSATMSAFPLALRFPTRFHTQSKWQSVLMFQRNTALILTKRFLKLSALMYLGKCARMFLSR